MLLCRVTLQAILAKERTDFLFKVRRSAGQGGESHESDYLPQRFARAWFHCPMRIHCKREWTRIKAIFHLLNRAIAEGPAKKETVALVVMKHFFRTPVFLAVLQPGGCREISRRWQVKTLLANGAV